MVRPRICVSNKFPGDAKVDDLGTTVLINTDLEQWSKSFFLKGQIANILSLPAIYLCCNYPTLLL